MEKWAYPSASSSPLYFADQCHQRRRIVSVSVIFKIAGIGICIALLNQILIKSGKDEMAMMTTLAGVIIVLVIIVKMLAEFFDTIKVFMEF